MLDCGDMVGSALFRASRRGNTALVQSLLRHGTIDFNKSMHSLFLRHDVLILFLEYGHCILSECFFCNCQELITCIDHELGFFTLIIPWTWVRVFRSITLFIICYAIKVICVRFILNTCHFAFVPSILSMIPLRTTCAEVLPLQLWKMMPTDLL